MSEIDYSIVSKVIDQDTQNRQALSLLLRELRDKADHHLAIQVRMGKVASYLTSVPLSWVASKVRFAADLPMFKEKESIEGSKRIAVDQETIETVQQRQPDWRRQQQMTAYLARRHHKFPPLLLVGYQHWVYQDESDRWTPDGKAMHDSLTLASLEPTSTYWDLDDSDTVFYALDGQHRLMAILGLNELVTTGYLYALDESRKQRKEPPLSLDDLIGRMGNSGGDKHAIHEGMQHLMDERIGIEIVPAVIIGETRDLAFRRLRQLFVDVNEHAKKLTNSELAQLDENHGFRIVARRLMRHPLLRSTEDSDGVSISRVHMKRQTLSEQSPSYTTLHALSTIVERYLIERETPPHVSLWRPLVKGLFERPDEESLEQGRSAMTEYLDALCGLPSHEAFVQGKAASELRGLDGDDNILFRPIAQTALAEAVGKVSRAGISLTTISRVLAEQEERGQLRLRDHRTPWFGVLCDPVPDYKMRRHKRQEKLCCRLFEYLLGGGIPDDVDREELRADFALERRVSDEEAIDLSGSEVKLEEVRLPNPWR